jgi:perosamine synthetase
LKFNIPITKPFFDIIDAESAYKTILSGWVSQAGKVKEFENAINNYIGSKYSIAVTNCTSALYLSLLVSGIKEKDEVICPSYSFIATSNSILFTGATPIFADVDFTTGNINLNEIKKKLSKKTKGVILVHQIGMPGDLFEIKKFCKDNALFLIEDAACALGSIYQDHKIGYDSDLACFSFHPRKVITTGEGGIIVTSDYKKYEILLSIRFHGKSKDNKYNILGFNYKLTDIQASLGIQQLKKINWIISQRRKIAEKYNNTFCGLNNLIIQKEKDGVRTNYQSYIVYIKKSAKLTRDDILGKLNQSGIYAIRGIMTSHRENIYMGNKQKYHLPVSEDLSDNSILLPIYPQLTDEESDYIIETFIKILS